VPSTPDLIGRETPRIFTPPLRPLTPETSWGFSVIEFATDMLGVDLMPWQQWLLIHALERNPDGTPRFRTVLVLVARQNGKSTLLQVLSLYMLFVAQVTLVLGTAQDLDTAEDSVGRHRGDG
jgi:phage terminase large subunit-like protein